MRIVMYFKIFNYFVKCISGYTNFVVNFFLSGYSMDDDEDEFKLFQKFYKMKRREEWEVQFATKKFKKDFTKSTPTPSPKGGKITSVRKDLTKSTSYPSPDGEKIHPLVKRTPVRKNLTESTSSPSPNGEKNEIGQERFHKIHFLSPSQWRKSRGFNKASNPSG